MPQNEDFTLVVKRQHNPALYNFLLHSTVWHAHAKLPKVTHHPATEQRTAYHLLHLNVAQQQPLPWLGEACTLTDAHIRVDEMYKAPNSSVRYCTEWHVTAVFRDSSTEQNKTLRVFYYGDTPLYATLDHVEINDPILKQQLYLFCAPAVRIIFILKSLLQKEQNALETAYAAAKQPFANLGLDCTTSADTLRATLEKCIRINETLNKYNGNRYAAEIAHTQRTIDLILQHRELRIATAKAAVADMQVADDVGDSATTTTTSHTQSKSAKKKQAAKARSANATFDAELDAINKDIARIERLANSNNGQEIKTAYATLPDLEQKIIAAWDKQPHSTKPVDLFAQLRDLPQPSIIFERLLAEQKIDAAIQIYPMVYQELTGSFYAKLCVKILNMPNLSTQLESKYAELLHLFDQYSDEYRVAFWLLWSSYVSYKIEEVPIGQVFWLSLAYTNKLILLKTVMEQRKPSFTMGMKCGDRYSDIACALLSRSNNQACLSVLLNLGIPCEYPPGQVPALEMPSPDLGPNQPSFTGTPLWVSADNSAFGITERRVALINSRDTVAVPSAFYQACYTQRMVYMSKDFMLRLAHMSSPLYLLLGVARLTMLHATNHLPTKDAPTLVVRQHAHECQKFIQDECNKVILSGANRFTVLVHVPDPERYAKISAIFAYANAVFTAMGDEEKLQILKTIHTMSVREQRISDLKACSHNFIFVAHAAVMYLNNFLTPSDKNLQTSTQYMEAFQNAVASSLQQYETAWFATTQTAMANPSAPHIDIPLLTTQTMYTNIKLLMSLRDALANTRIALNEINSASATALPNLPTFTTMWTGWFTSSNSSTEDHAAPADAAGAAPRTSCRVS